MTYDKALLDDIVKNKRINIANKKKDSITKICSFTVKGEESTTKSTTGLGIGDTIYPVINTTNFMDSHLDVHSKTIWNKSAKEQNGRTFFITDHNMSFDSIISYPQDVDIMLQEIEWRKLGLDADGVTTALIFKTTLKDYANKSYLNALKAGMPIEHSIRMRYIDVSLAVNDKDYEEEYKNWQAYISEVVNKDFAYETGYFYYVKEAAISTEGSAVLRGSNSITPTLTEAKQSTEPTQVTQEKQSNKYSYYKTNH